MRLHLVDGDVLLDVLDMDWNSLISKVNDLSIRTLRPKLDPKLNRDFDIDCEAEFLDLVESIDEDGKVKEVLFKHSAYDALLKLVEWSSIGYWEAWEGRCFIYVENAI